MYRGSHKKHSRLIVATDDDIFSSGSTLLNPNPNPNPSSVALKKSVPLYIRS